MSPEALVQEQLDAYNARDLPRFLAVYGERIEVFRPPALTPALVGKAAFADHYATQRFNLPGLHAQVVNRLVVGNTVIDHERISGVRELPFEIAVAYKIADGLIKSVWAFDAA